MASGPHTFVTMVVFTAEKFAGNPLAIVSVRGNALTQQRKSLIAKEFKYPETVFIHDAPGPGQPRRVEIFTESGEEVPWAGHPIIGTAHFIFNAIERPVSTLSRDARQSAVFLTKAGPVPVYFNSYRGVAACAVPVNYHLHTSTVGLDAVVRTQPHVRIAPDFDNLKSVTHAWPVVSIVKGMTFILVDLTASPDVFAALTPSVAPEVKLDDGWEGGFVGVMYYVVGPRSEAGDGEPVIWNLAARMIEGGNEDPGTGSACSALSCYLALREVEKGHEEADLESKTEKLALSKTVEEDVRTHTKAEKVDRKVFGITQGKEMGRLCTIAVEVDVRNGKDGTRIEGVILSGRANMMTKGELLGA